MRATLIALLIIGSNAIAAAAASDDAAAVQQCVFRCNYSTSGAQPAYDRCVAKKCNGSPRKRR